MKRYVEHVMNMPVSLALRGRHTDDRRARAAWAAVMADLRAADRVFSTYRPDSHISRLNRGELTPAECPPEVTQVLALGHEAEHDSDGAFSIHRPGPDGHRTLDPSGVVKGWAADRAARHLRALPDTDYCLNTGGDLICRTLDPHTRPWHIGIEHPHNPQAVIAVVPIHDGAVATSGATHRGNHITDARTGRTPTAIASVTVVGATLTHTDIDATAAYANGPKATAWLRTRPIHAALLVWQNGTTTLIPEPSA
ncbi:FAD:protein FMN transferase [Actinokineospora sp. NBRC 105648]|uniref:FAD:protein FMN transferase n=1 Tax=Actinokineospora sp. NBRC 105648 TaxID=3032206 RepID=UPI0024A5D692|nr:FAD:protein FMN transferase [Actinokineospora sp. NBRC 105648]GLZ40280.1 FAD:protein FMN transferase [Actinokineospora sp. NBRC 105648]